MRVTSFTLVMLGVAGGMALVSVYSCVHLEGQIVTLQSIVVKGSPASPMSWRCGYHDVPKGMEPVGENRTSLDRRYLPTSCRSFTWEGANPRFGRSRIPSDADTFISSGMCL